MSLGNFYDYVPIRTFTTHGDIAQMTTALNTTPWNIYIIFGYFVGFVIWYFFTNTLIRTYVVLKMTTAFSRVCLMITCVIILFGYFGMIGFIGYGDISHFLSATSLIIIPGVIIACWPTRRWAEQQFLLFNAK